MRSVALALLALALAGCAGPDANLKAHLPDASAASAVELRQTPFFPQREYQCGPAALATVLVATGVDVTADALVDQVYLPARRGSLQAEMLASARRHGRLPYVVAPTLSALLAELRSGRPVLVLLNLALDALPVWHYAVVIGYDAEAGTLLLRSGTQARRTLSASRFLRSWRKSDSWAVVALEPGALPAGDDPDRYVRAVAGLESADRVAAARTAYAAALRRWPEHPASLLGLGNTEFALGRLEPAERAYRRLLRADPEHVPGLNNLANVLARRGCRAAALRRVERALGLAPADSAFREALESTRRDVVALDPRAEPAGAACAAS